MKKLAFLLIGFAGFIVACQSNKTEQNANDAVALDTNVQAGTQQFCYSYIKDKDTATLKVMTSGNITTGELRYNLYEKDKNNGIVEGELHGDTLLAEYTFNSEGKESVRQVAFLKKGDQLLEGFGDVVEGKNGKMMFKDTSKLTFGQSIVFTKVDCQ
ncbi:hypothetical protein [Pedobacter boryungensis]|uniref:Lipoprotein n=1 Tax=Pedobacter boryungensis TaxID=869962 RepID=A0ABX2DDV3_9SPHI|nr:hypothetical protein [Pedobacter boryungensis]NQX32264.1 hypothetical protein [Pedobacter boryungensis]